MRAREPGRLPDQRDGHSIYPLGPTLRSFLSLRYVSNRLSLSLYWMAPSNIPLMAIVKEREREREDRQAVMCGADKTIEWTAQLERPKGATRPICPALSLPLTLRFPFY
jgi:hypothetical protein